MASHHFSIRVVLLYSEESVFPHRVLDMVMPRLRISILSDLERMNVSIQNNSGLSVFSQEDSRGGNWHNLEYIVSGLPCSLRGWTRRKSEDVCVQCRFEISNGKILRGWNWGSRIMLTQLEQADICQRTLNTGTALGNESAVVWMKGGCMNYWSSDTCSMHEEEKKNNEWRASILCLLATYGGSFLNC